MGINHCVSKFSVQLVKNYPDTEGVDTGPG